MRKGKGLLDVICINCQAKMVDVCSEPKGEYICWCKDCGTILTANTHDPIGSDDFAIPSLTLIGKAYGGVREKPVYREYT